MSWYWQYGAWTSRAVHRSLLADGLGVQWHLPAWAVTIRVLLAASVLRSIEQSQSANSTNLFRWSWVRLQLTPRFIGNGCLACNTIRLKELS